MEKNEELSRMAYEARYYQSQLEELQRQGNSIQAAMAELTMSIRGLGSVKDAGSTLMGVGSGTFVPVSVANAERVLVEVGGRVFAEKTVPDAIQLLESRRKNLDAALGKVAESMDAVSARLQALEERAGMLQQ
ncbi:MAG: prefoldin subunit alpha [Candidatus Micrarchaeota archaeon]